MISLPYWISIFDIENNTDLISTLLFFYYYTIATTPLFNSQEKTYFSKSNWLYISKLTGKICQSSLYISKLTGEICQSSCLPTKMIIRMRVKGE